MKHMFKHIDIRFLILTIVSFTLTYCTMKGITQQYIRFAGVENEIAFTAATIALGVFGILGIRK